MSITQSHDIEVEPYYPMTFRKFVKLHAYEMPKYHIDAIADSMAQQIREEIDNGILESFGVLPRKTTI